MVIEKHKINDVVVKPVKINKPDNKEILGSDLLPLYSNVFLSARKHSGKTSVIYNIIKRCCNKESKVVVFCPTFNKDPSWVAIQEYLDKKHIPNEFHMSIHDDGALRNLIDEMQTCVYSSDEESDDQYEPQIVKFDNEVRVKVKKKKKKISQKYMIIFDDISTELKDKQIGELTKKNRHLRCKCIISSQYYLDLMPSTRRQIDCFMLFGGLSEKKLEEIYANTDMCITYEQLLEMYKDSCSKKFQFLYANAFDNDYRCCFNMAYKIKDENNLVGLESNK